MYFSVLSYSSSASTSMPLWYNSYEDCEVSDWQIITASSSYKSVIDSLQDLLTEPGFVEKCEAWREDETPDGTLADVYNGQVWKDFLSRDGIPFLSVPYNYGLHLNMDWFRPFK